MNDLSHSSHTPQTQLPEFPLNLICVCLLEPSSEFSQFNASVFSPIIASKSNQEPCPRCELCKYDQISSILSLLHPTLILHPMNGGMGGGREPLNSYLHSPGMQPLQLRAGVLQTDSGLPLIVICCPLTGS